MGQFIKFTFASCLGVFLAMAIMFFLLIMIAVGAASAGQTTTLDGDNVLKLDIDYLVPEHTNNTPTTMTVSLQQDHILGIQDILDIIAHAKEDGRISGIYLYPRMTYLGPTQTAQLCAALRDFKSSGKWVLSYSEYYEQGSYALAAQADTVMVNPIGSVDFRGYAAFVPFFKDLLDKIGLDMHIYYAGDFKSATEPFRRNDMSPENRLQTREYLDDAYTEYLGLVSEGRGISIERLREIADGLRARNAEDAAALGLVDKVGYSDEAFAWMRGRLGLDPADKVPFVSLNDYFKAMDRGSSSSSDRIAVVYAEGEIMPGDVDYGMIGDERYVEMLEKIRHDERVKAIVLRVNSPGGSILAAENILREMNLIREAGKPIVVSMGDYAASGGYYISAMADSIFAEASTLTGSIGVYTLIPNAQELMNDKLGVHFDTVRTGEYSASFTPFLEWSEAEHTYLQERTDAYYDLFVGHVSKYRNMTRDEVHAIAQGRIWSGLDATANGLVDRIGDLDDAVKSAAAIAGLEDYRTSEYPRVPDPLNKLIIELTGDESEIAEKVVDSRVSRHVPFYKDLKQLLRYTEPVARLPLVLSF